MKNTGIFKLLILFLLIHQLPGFSQYQSQKFKDSIPIFDFNKYAENLGQWTKTQDADCHIAENDAQGKFLEVNSGFAIKEPGVKLLRTAQTPWNLEGYYLIKADVSNTSDHKIQVELFVGDSDDDLIRWYCSDYVDLEPNERKTIIVPIAWTPWVYEPQQEMVGFRGMPGRLKRDIPSIDEFSFNVRYATQNSSFAIHNVSAVGKLEKRSPENAFPVFDAFGQVKATDWSTKIHSIADLKANNQKEIAELNEFSSAPERSIYGGWKGGPKLKATGFFRTEKYNGKWWFVDPDGYLFWSAGINCVSFNTGNTGIQYRSKYFEKIPEESKITEQFFGKSNWASFGFYKDKTPYTTFNFYAHNLYLKYGEDWKTTYRERIHARIKSWGMNTIGFMSDFGATKQKKTPYVGSIWIHGTPKIEASEGYWGKFHDVFDDEFVTIVKRSIKWQKTGANDPWCIGFFVDNEMSWGQTGSLSIATLKSPAHQPAKIEFVGDLKSKYKKIKKLNESWGTNYKDWGELLLTTNPPKYEDAQEDYDIFYKKIALTYFKIVNDELKEVAPNQNYFGCRFAWANNDITLNAAAQYCDVISFNKYETSVENVALPKESDKPIIIGEFHFGSSDRGMIHPGVKAVANQEQRGLHYESYIKGALRNRQIVGAHWFQYTDEPASGRGDEENYNVGLIDICDTPYEELIGKIRETCYPMYEYRNEN